MTLMSRKNLFNDQWGKSHLKKIKELAGPRYTPQLHVSLPISDIFDGLCRTEKFYTSFQSRYGKLNREFNHVQPKYDDTEAQNIYKRLKKQITNISNILVRVKEYDTSQILFEKVSSHSKKATEIAWKLSSRVRKIKDSVPPKDIYQDKASSTSKSDQHNSNLHYIHETIRELTYFEELQSSVQVKLANKPFLLLTGLAGSGKTHLLCDLFESRIKSHTTHPNILVFGESFSSTEEPLIQIAKQLDINLSPDSMLRMLDKTAKKNGCRAILAIDALNETPNHKYWKRKLRNITEKIKKYPNVALIVSIRSGFEDEIISKTLKGYFVHNEHRGFEFREWEAINKFFNEFELPLPEIPLLMPEFKEPLFLLLFCAAFGRKNRNLTRKTQAQLKNIKPFRGHVGATHIFEAFTKQAADSIASKFNLPKGRSSNGEYVIWDTIVEKMAASMVDHNNDRITEKAAQLLVKEAHPTVNSSFLLKEMERNLIVVKVPKYSYEKKQYDGFEYRFPFQKFSDHLIARYLFKKYGEEFGSKNKNFATAKQFFSKRRKIGKFLCDYWNRGIVEALSIQCPEYLKGLELVEVAPYLQDLESAQQAFVASLIWRKPTAFNKDLKNTLKYINSKIIRTESGETDLINAFLSVAPIPEHPFNADFLHQHLIKHTMPKRDYIWSIFLHYQRGEKGSVDRLVDWAWSDHDKSHIHDESIRLYSVALCWFLTSSNRFLRDKSTKALIAILTGRLPIILSLLKQFKKVNDPYLMERLYAVAYGCAIRSSKDKKALKALSEWVYSSLFKQGKPPTHILIRDYARGIIEVGLKEKVGLRIEKKKITPPFKSVWPKKIPSEKSLKRKFYPEDFFKDKTKERGFLSIWSSLMYNYGTLGDFGNYVVNSTLHHWSGYRLNKNEIPKNKIYEDFKSQLSKEQKSYLKNWFPLSDPNRLEKLLSEAYADDESEIGEDFDVDGLKKEIKDSGKQFERSLSSKLRKCYQNEIKPFLDEWGRINDPRELFDTHLAQRWIFNRVVQLGWKPEIHGEFDNRLNYHRIDRAANKPERIGKKYQWIALHEFLAMVADNFKFKEDEWDESSKQYYGPWQIGKRDIDPTCTLKDKNNSRPNDLPSFHNYKKTFSYNAWKKNLTNSQWSENYRDLPKCEKLIQLVDDTQNEWLVLEGSYSWEETTPPDQERYHAPTRKLWCMFKSYLVQKESLKKVYSWAKNQNYFNRWMPESHEFYECYLGEYPWAPAFTIFYTPYFNRSGWSDEARNGQGPRIPAKILVTDDAYLSSGSHTDCSTDDGVRVKLPCKWIIDKMQLSQPNIDGRFYDKNGDLISFDPRVYDDDFPSVVLINKTAFSKFLESQGYAMFWTFLSEKMIVGGDMRERSGWIVSSGAYTLNENLAVHGRRKRYIFGG